MLPPLVMTKVIVILLVTVFVWNPTNALSQAAPKKTIYMAVWRGCEEACKSFIDFFDKRGQKCNFIIRDAGRNKSKLEGFVDEIKILQPDLLVTWGTSVSKRLLGKWDSADPKKHITKIPAVFMIVADPVGAGISKNNRWSGRVNVTGTLNRAPAETQLQTIRSYKPIKSIGMVYNDNELNAKLSAEAMRKAAEVEGVLFFVERVKNDRDGSPRIDDIDSAIKRIALKNPEFLYVGSSSFLTKYRERVTSAALKHKLPLAAGSEVLVRKARGLLGVAAKYSSIGRLAAMQAQNIIFRKKIPGELPIKKLDRYSVLINLTTAKELDLYPPISLLKISEIIR